ncbi:MAG TPA: hypothetical protein VN408_01300 [Actinoplanes sp.]|nr:hypothetical protein [Actinoplanes sp.]
MTSTDHETEVLPRPDGDSTLTEALAAAAPRRWWNRTTLALLGVALLTGGFLGGIQAQSHWGTTTAATAPTSRGGPPGGMPGSATGGGPSNGSGSGPSNGSGSMAIGGDTPSSDPGGTSIDGGTPSSDPGGTSIDGGTPGSGPGGTSIGVPGRGTTGTVKLVDGTTLYLQTESGETVTVRTGTTTTIKQSQIVTLDKLLTGVPVTVQGVADSEGILTATSVTAG